jgi:hypothetical protein
MLTESSVCWNGYFMDFEKIQGRYKAKMRYMGHPVFVHELTDRDFANKKEAIAFCKTLIKGKVNV